MKNTMNALLATAFLFFSSIATAQDMKELEVVKRDFLRTGDMSHVDYASLRCSALNMALAALTLKNGDKQSSERFESNTLVYFQISEMVQKEISKKRNAPKMDFAENIMVASKKMTKLYVERMSNNWAKTSEYVTSDAQLTVKLPL